MPGLDHCFHREDRLRHPHGFLRHALDPHARYWHENRRACNRPDQNRNPRRLRDRMHHAFLNYCKCDWRSRRQQTAGYYDAAECHHHALRDLSYRPTGAAGREAQDTGHVRVRLQLHGQASSVTIVITLPRASTLFRA